MKLQQDPLDLLSEIRKLMELKGENPFKVRAMDKAIRVLSGRTDLEDRAREGTLQELEGIGKGISEILTEFILHGVSNARDELVKSLPKGLLELVEIPGVGPKKAQVLMESLQIHSVSELEKACRKGLLVEVKGFGQKAQDKILEGIAFQNSNQGFHKYSDIYESAEQLIEALRVAFPGHQVSETGELRRKLEVLRSLDFLIETKAQAPRKKEDSELTRRAHAVIEDFKIKMDLASLICQIHFAPLSHWGYELAKTTGSTEHWAALDAPESFEAATEEAFYQKLGLSWIPPEMRETGEEVALAKRGGLDKLLALNGIRGVFHNHTTRSDGEATLEQMVAGAEKLGLEYIGISDHSQSAFYAQGLKPEDLKEQEKEIRKAQEKHPNIKIFWGIESDILSDGSLDYEPSVLKKFDFVIASVHARFQMGRDEMTQRILAAIQNPYTRFVGHVTGRLLLGRKGYDVDMEAILKEASKHDVAIELNANPARLDIDWRWGPSMRREKTPTAINPDAHWVEGLNDTRFGITMARKALLPVSQIMNTRSAPEVEKWLKRS